MEPLNQREYTCEPTRDLSGPSDDRDDEDPTTVENADESFWARFRLSRGSVPSPLPLPPQDRAAAEHPSRKRLREEVAAFDPARAAQVNAEYTAAWCGDREALVRLSTAQDEPLAKSYVALLLLFTGQYRDETRGLSLAEQVLPWLENSGQSCPHALFVLATLKYHGTAAAQDVSAAVNAFSHLTMRHHANAQCALARHFDDTASGSPQQEMFALCMYIKAAAQDHPEGLYRLALHFLVQPHRTQEDEELAVEHLRRAALRGHPAALQHLGDCLQHGVGALRDLRGAVWCYKTSAERHDALGLSCLAECTAACLYTGMSHFNGAEGLVRCDTSAHEFFSLALHGEEDTVAEAAYMLGFIAWHGLVTKQDVHRAEEFFTNAASKGHVRAKIELALLLTFVKNTQDARDKAADLLAELVAAAVIDMKIPFVVGVFLPQSRIPDVEGGGKCAVLVRCLRRDADGTYDYRPDEDPLNTNAYGGLKNCTFPTDLQWVETAAPLLKVGLLHLVLQPASQGVHWHLDVQRALRLLQAPMRQPNRTVTVTCWCDADECMDKAYNALEDMVTFEQLRDTDERIVRRHNLRSVATTLF